VLHHIRHQGPQPRPVQVARLHHIAFENDQFHRFTFLSVFYSGQSPSEVPAAVVSLATAAQPRPQRAARRGRSARGTQTSSSGRGPGARANSQQGARPLSGRAARSASPASKYTGSSSSASGVASSAAQTGPAPAWRQAGVRAASSSSGSRALSPTGGPSK